MMQHQTDSFLGTIAMNGSLYVVRERSFFKKGLAVQDIQSAADFTEACKIMGKLTAKIHARADGDSGWELFSTRSETVILQDIKQDRKGWRKALMRFAFHYAEQVGEDYQHFRNTLQNPGAQPEQQYDIIGDVS
jgi:hypothetical protein